jgi:hypothetical protein
MIACGLTAARLRLSIRRATFPPWTPLRSRLSGGCARHRGSALPGCSARQQSWPEVGGSQRECFVSPATRRAMHGRRASTAPGSNARPPQTDPGVFCRKEAQKRSASEALEAPIGARTASSAGGILVPFCGHSFRALSAFVTTRCARRGCGASHARAATQKSRPASSCSSYERSLAHACVQKVEPALRAGPGLTGIRHHSKCGSESRPHLQQAL